MTQSIAKLKIISQRAVSLKIGTPALKLKSKLVYVGQIVGGSNITVTTVNGVSTINNSIAFTTSAVEFTMDGAGGPLVTGYKGAIEVPFACQIQSLKIVADAPGNLVMDIRKKAFASLPFVPGDSIVGASPPTLVASQFGADTTLLGWSIGINANDLLAFYITSGNIVNATISLTVKRI